MIQKFVDRYMERKDEIQKQFEENMPDNYCGIVKAVVSVISKEYDGPDPERIHRIDDGDYQGTLLYVIPELEYQPCTYYYVKIFYGSCGGCDTLEGIRDCYDGNKEGAVRDLMTLALHIVQGIKRIEDESE